MHEEQEELVVNIQSIRPGYLFTRLISVFFEGAEEIFNFLNFQFIFCLPASLTIAGP